MIVTDEAALRIPCSDVLPDEIGPLLDQLDRELKHSAEIGMKGIGLAAPQIGIGKNIAIVRIDGQRSVNLVNCKIAAGYDKDIFEEEGCLSFPGRFEKTIRFQEIHVVGNLIEPYSFICTGLLAVVCQHECLPYNSLVQTEFGPRKIGEIVKNKDSCSVWCLDENNNFVMSKIIGHRKKQNEIKKWVRVKVANTGPNKNLVCTEDHLCASVDDIVYPNKINFIAAKNLLGKYLVRLPTDKLRNSEKSLYNREQMSAIIGGLLGDLCISSRGEVVISHGEPQKTYAEFKALIMNGRIKPGYSGYRKEWSNIAVHAPITEQTKLLRKLAYVDKRKTIKNILNYIDEISLAFWYMDDGCLLQNRDVAQFHTEGFTKTDVELLSNYLLSKFDINSSVYERKLKSGSKYILVLNKEGSSKLFKMISKYIVLSMRYKLPETYRDVEFTNIDNRRLPFSAKLVKEIKPLPYLESSLYDIEVEKYHNFVANNTVVHNCDHLVGKLLPDVALPQLKTTKKKLRPNDLCTCGSGKKYKKCCLLKTHS